MKVMLGHRSPVILALALATLCACVASELESPEVKTRRAAIVHGDPWSGDSAVVAILRDTQAICTGVLVKPRVVLTAAHCLDSPEPTHVAFGSSLATATSTIAIERVRKHPDYEAAPALHDLGLILLLDPVPEDIPPGQLLEGQLDGLQVGTPLRLVGFGDESPFSFTVVQKREGATHVSGVDEDSFYHGPNTAMTCSGDSGGPAFALVGGEEKIVGIASNGDALCDEFGRHVRLQNHLRFVAAFPEPNLTTGAICDHSSQCKTGHCISPLRYGALGYCSLPCAADIDCPESLECILDRAGQRYCRIPEVEPGELGSTCETPLDCQTRFCVTRGSAVSRCSLRCFRENSIACPRGFSCEPLPDGLQACLPMSAVPEATPVDDIDAGGGHAVDAGVPHTDALSAAGSAITPPTPAATTTSQPSLKPYGGGGTGGRCSVSFAGGHTRHAPVATLLVSLVTLLERRSRSRRGNTKQVI